jgi:hypothetical protein
MCFTHTPVYRHQSQSTQQPHGMPAGDVFQRQAMKSLSDKTQTFVCETHEERFIDN